MFVEEAEKRGAVSVFVPLAKAIEFAKEGPVLVSAAAPDADFADMTFGRMVLVQGAGRGEGGTAVFCIPMLNA